MSRSIPPARFILVVAALLAVGALRAQEPSGALEIVPPSVILDTQKAPEHPPAAMKGRFGGSVLLEAKILTDGKVGQVKVLESSSPRLGFEEAAIDAVKSWRFDPAMRGTEPIEYALRFRINFRGGGGVGRHVSVSTGSTGQTETLGPRESAPAPTPARQGGN